MPTGLTFTAGAAVTEAQMDALDLFVNNLELATLFSPYVNVPYGAGWQTQAFNADALRCKYNNAQTLVRGIIEFPTVAVGANTLIGTLPLAARPSESWAGYVVRDIAPKSIEYLNVTTNGEMRCPISVGWPAGTTLLIALTIPR